jgi:hypothetical protein
VAAVMILAAASHSSGVLHFLEITVTSAAGSSVLIALFTAAWAISTRQLFRLRQGLFVSRASLRYLHILTALHIAKSLDVTPDRRPPE